MAGFIARKGFLTLLFFAASCSIMAAKSVLPTNVNNEDQAISVVHNQMKREISTHKAEIRKLQKQLAASKLKTDSLENRIKEMQGEVQNQAADTKQKIDSTHSSIANLHSSIKDKAVLCGTILGVIILVLLVAVLALKKKLHDNSASLENALQALKNLQNTHQNLEEGSVALDNKVTELLEKQLSLPQSVSKDHSLAFKVADEIARIETNLYRMEPSTRGYKQLARSVQRMKDSFMTKGYEISDLLGKPYNEGMKVVANFVIDETLPEGSTIITGVAKPQIIFNGKLIQAAQITVSQNI